MINSGSLEVTQQVKTKDLWFGVGLPTRLEIMVTEARRLVLASRALTLDTCQMEGDSTCCLRMDHTINRE